MRRYLKVSLILILASLAVLLTTTLILRHIFPPERIKGMLIAEAEKTLGRKVSLGDVEINILHGLDIRDVYIGEDKSFGDLPFIKIKRITIGYTLSEIFHKKITFNSIEIDSPQLYIRSKGGKLALLDLIKKPTAEALPHVEEKPSKPTKPSKPFPVTVFMQGCKVKGIELFYESEEAKAAINGIDLSMNGDLYPFKGLNVKVYSFDNENIDISAKGMTLKTGLLTDLRIALKEMGSISAQGTVTLKGVDAGIKDKGLHNLDVAIGADLKGEMNGGARINNISVAIGKGSIFNLSGSIKDLKALKGLDINLTGESDLAEASRIAAEFLPMQVSGFFKIKDIRVTGDAPDSLTLKSSLLLNGIKVSHKGINLRADGSIKAEGNSRGDLAISEMRLDLNNALIVEASAMASRWGKGRVNGRAHVVLDNGKTLALLPEEISKKIGKIDISGSTTVDLTGGRESEKGPIKIAANGLSDLKNLSAGPVSVDDAAVNFSVTSEDLLNGRVAADAGVKGKGVKVSKGEISVSDEEMDVNITASSPDIFRKSAVVDAEVKVHGVTVIKGDMGFRSDRAAINLKALSGDLAERRATIDIKVKLKGIRANKGDIDFREDHLDVDATVLGDFKNGDISLKTLEVALPGLFMAGVDGDIKGWGQDISINARVDGIDHKRWMEKLPASIRQKLPKIDLEGKSSITAFVTGGTSSNSSLLPKVEGVNPLNIKGQFKTTGLGVSLPEKGISVSNSEGSIDFDLSQKVQRISGMMKVGSLQKSGLQEAPISVVSMFECLADGPDMKIKKISARIPEKAASIFISGEVAGYMKEPRPNLEITLSFNSKNKVDLLKGLNADGGLFFMGEVTSPKEKEVIVNGRLKFEHLFMSYQERAAVKDLNGEIKMVQGIRYAEGLELIGEGDNIEATYTSSIYDLMRPYMKNSYDLTLASAIFDEYELGPLRMDIAVKNGKLLIDRYELALFDGGITGSLRAAYGKGVPEYSLYSNMAGIRLDRIIKGSKGGDDVTVNADLNIKGKWTDIEGDVNVTSIGKDVLDTALLRLDPTESNPQIVDVRNKLNTLGWVPKEVSIWIRHGELNLDVTLQRRGFTLLNILGLEKIPVRRVPLGYLIKKGLKKTD